jgi:hypothetical protein
MFGIDLFDAALLPAMSVALLAGVLSFLSPCVLPIVPPYLAYMSGISMRELTEEGGRGARKAVVPALFFVMGLSTLFLFLGFTASSLGRLFLEHRELFAQIAGGVVIVLGLHFLGVCSHRASAARGADRSRRPGGLGLWRLCAGAGLRLWLDALHRADPGDDPDAGGDRGIGRARHRACWASTRWGWGCRSCWRRSSSAGRWR